MVSSVFVLVLCGTAAYPTLCLLCSWMRALGYSLFGVLYFPYVVTNKTASGWPVVLVARTPVLTCGLGVATPIFF